MNPDIKSKIAHDFGFAGLSPLEQERMIEKVGNMLFESVLERSFDSLVEKDLDEYEKMLGAAGADYQKIMGFFQERVPQFPTIVSEELGRLKKMTSLLMT
ncbi:MAG TPA: DUF5663 domain-containing protein [Candidatus Paceibacterota bacterium]